MRGIFAGAAFKALIASGILAILAIPLWGLLAVPGVAEAFEGRICAENEALIRAPAPWPHSSDDALYCQNGDGRQIVRRQNLINAIAPWHVAFFAMGVWPLLTLRNWRRAKARQIAIGPIHD